ncbi:MAG: hypothetical protein AAF799_46775 [Myxococcota bacterium]
MNTRRDSGRALSWCGLILLLAGCDPLSEPEPETEDLRPRAAQNIPCGYAYESGDLSGVPTTLSQSSSRTALASTIGSVALAPSCSVSLYDHGGDVLLRGDEARATYEQLSGTAAEYTCSCVQGAATPVAEATKGSSRLPLWEGVSVDLKAVPGGWLRAVETIRFPTGRGSVMASLGKDGRGNDRTAFIIAEQGRAGTVDLAADYTTGFCTAADCSCTPTDDLSCSTHDDISSSVETLTAFQTS